MHSKKLKKDSRFIDPFFNRARFKCHNTRVRRSFCGERREVSEQNERLR